MGAGVDDVRPSSHLTAKLTAKLHDTMDPQGMTLDPIHVLSCADAAGDDRPSNLRVLESPKYPVAQRAPNCDVASAVAGIKIAWRPPMGSVAASGLNG
jgi:hypothetical protein